MSYLKLRDVKSGQVHEFDLEFVRAGRDPDIELSVSGDAARVVSTHHAQFAFKNNAWTVEDLGSSNGTWLDEKRLSPGSPQALAVGHVVGFGEGGPRFVVDAVQKKMTPKTVIEIPGSRHVRPSAATEKLQGLADLVPPPKPAAPAPEPPKRAARPSAPTERMRGLDADAAVAAAHAAHTSPPQPIPADAPLPPPLPPPPPRASHAAPPPTKPAPSPPPPAPAPSAPEPRPAPAATTVSPAHEGRASGPFVSLILRELRNKQTFTVRGGRIRIGRGDECELRPVASGDTSVSRIHAEIVLKPEGTVVVRDAGSRNGTFVDGQRVQTEIAIKKGDIILLGEGGPELRIDELTAPGAPAAPATPAAPAAPPAEKPGRERRSFGGKGATAFMRELVVETTKKSSSKMRWIIWSFVIVLGLLVAGGWWYLDQQAKQTSAAFAEQRKLFTSAQAAADSLRTTNAAELTRLQHGMDSARQSAASPAVLDSFRRALGEQQRQSANLGASLERAQSALSHAAAAGDSQRKLAQRDQARLQAQLDKATQNSGGVSSAELERLQQRVAAAAARADSIELRMHAVRGVDLPAVAQANQASVGLITAFFGDKAFDGTGFVITASGYMITNRHVAAGDGKPDSIQVQMADQKTLLTADVVNVAPNTRDAPDVAVLKIRGYAGPHVVHVDWADSSLRQGAPGVLIGFPAGLRMALDNEAFARTSVSAGTFMSLREDEIRFQGFTVGGSSGSPVFNADGALVALHRAGVLDPEGHLTVGMGIEVPIRMLLPFLPADVKAELGLH